MRRIWGLLFLSTSYFGLGMVGAQQPAPKAPAFPPINPALARPDVAPPAKLTSPGVGIAWSEEPGVLVVASEGPLLTFWHKEGPGFRIAETKLGHAAPVSAVAAAGPTFASAGADGKILTWSATGDKILQTLPAVGIVRALAVAPDGKVLASAADEGGVQLWDPISGKPGTKLVGPTDWQLALAFSADGKLLASGGYDGKLWVWEVASGKKNLEVAALPPLPPNTPKDAPPRPTNVVSALAFAPDGKTIALGGSEASIHLFQAADGKLVRSMPGHTISISGLAFHPTGTLLVSSSKDRTLKLWNPAAGQMLKSLEGHTAWVQGVTFIAKGTRLASVGADQTVRLWELTDPNAKK